jgi:hypothetical protein
VGIRCADHATPHYLLKLALTSSTSGGRSVGIVHWRTKAPEFLMVLLMVTSEKTEMLGPRQNVILIFVTLQEVHMELFTNADSKCLSSFSFVFLSFVYYGYESIPLWNIELILWMCFITLNFTCVETVMLLYGCSAVWKEGCSWRNIVSVFRLYLVQLLLNIFSIVSRSQHIVRLWPWFGILYLINGLIHLSKSVWFCL